MFLPTVMDVRVRVELSKNWEELKMINILINQRSKWEMWKQMGKKNWKIGFG